MCSVRLLIRDVRIAICTSGDPESDPERRYCSINSFFCSFVTVIAGRDSPRCPVGEHCRRLGATNLLTLLQLPGLFLKKLEANYKPPNVSVWQGIARPSRAAWWTRPAPQRH